MSVHRGLQPRPETLLVDAPAAEAFLPKAAKALQDAGVTLYGDEQAVRLTGCAPMTEDWHTEYLDLKMSVRVVDGVQAAVEHINRYGSHHTDAIITENRTTAATFEALVDSADVYWQLLDALRGRIPLRFRRRGRHQHGQAARERPGRHRRPGRLTSTSSKGSGQEPWRRTATEGKNFTSRIFKV
jgi:hypothetical protein